MLIEFDQARAQSLVKDLFRITDELGAMTGRRFTPDGHLVGSLGEVFAASAYSVVLQPHSTKACDAVSMDGRRIEIKATFSDRVAFRSHDVDCLPDHCLVIRLKKDAAFEEVYNGPIKPIVEKLSVRKLPSSGQRQISLVQLRTLNAAVPEAERLPRKSRDLTE
jgi:hypothetical protein